jgi:hypothetical protein
MKEDNRWINSQIDIDESRVDFVLISVDSSIGFGEFVLPVA